MQLQLALALILLALMLATQQTLKTCVHMRGPLVGGNARAVFCSQSVTGCQIVRGKIYTFPQVLEASYQSPQDDH